MLKKDWRSKQARKLPIFFSTRLQKQALQAHLGIARQSATAKHFHLHRTRASQRTSTDQPTGFALVAWKRSRQSLSICVHAHSTTWIYDCKMLLQDGFCSEFFGWIRHLEFTLRVAHSSLLYFVLSKEPTVICYATSLPGRTASSPRPSKRRKAVTSTALKCATNVQRQTLYIYTRTCTPKFIHRYTPAGKQPVGRGNATSGPAPKTPNAKLRG